MRARPRTGGGAAGTVRTARRGAAQGGEGGLCCTRLWQRGRGACPMQHPLTTGNAPSHPTSHLCMPLLNAHCSGGNAHRDRPAQPSGGPGGWKTSRQLPGTPCPESDAPPLPRPQWCWVFRGAEEDFWPQALSPPPPRVTFRPVDVPLRGPGQSPARPFACCVGSLRSVGRCGRCS